MDDIGFGTDFDNAWQNVFRNLFLASLAIFSPNVTKFNAFLIAIALVDVVPTKLLWSTSMFYL